MRRSRAGGVLVMQLGKAFTLANFVWIRERATLAGRTGDCAQAENLLSAHRARGQLVTKRQLLIAGGPAQA